MDNGHGYWITLFYIGGYIAFITLLIVVGFIIFKFLRRNR